MPNNDTVYGGRPGRIFARAGVDDVAADGRSLLDGAGDRLVKPEVPENMAPVVVQLNACRLEPLNRDVRCPVADPDSTRTSSPKPSAVAC